jgi:hypothetical protein
MTQQILSTVQLALEYPLLTAIVFIVCSTLFFLLFTAPHQRAALSGLGRLTAAIITAPFRFLRSAARILSDYEDGERQYGGTRAYLLWKFCQFAYLGILVLCLLVLAGGLTASFLALYPSAQLAERRALSDRITEQKKSLTDVEKQLADAEFPAVKEAQKTRLADMDKKIQEQEATLAAGWNSIGEDLAPQKQAVTNYLGQLRPSEGLLKQVNEALDTFFARDGVLASNEAGQVAFRNYADGRVRLLAVAAERDELRAQVESGGAVVAGLKARQQQAAQDIKDLEERKGKISILMSWENILLSLTTLLSALGMVLYIVWTGGIFIDILAWVINGMRALERKAAGTLGQPAGAAGAGARHANIDAAV